MGHQASASDWLAAERVLDQLMDLDPAARSEALGQLTEPGLVRECVIELLAAMERPGLLDHAGPALAAGMVEAAAPDLAGQVIDRYRMESLIGCGGMSAVYRASRIDGAFDEAVAIKLLNPALLSTRWSEQFQREVRFLASLRHPNIASLLDAGVSPDGTPWMVTELIDGVPIDQWCGPSVPVRQRVALIRDLCRAVAFAQANLIVHRDIKPDNVLVTPEGRVVLLDFGIARALNAGGGDDQLTQPTRVFTPQYAAPEQLTGEPVTTATDVFAIGALLFRLLTGQAPFDASLSRAGGTVIAAPSRQLASDSSLSPSAHRQLRQLLRGDLDNIVQKAMAPEPGLRYANAEQLGDDLEAWLAFRAVRARRPSLPGRLRLFWLRRTALAGTLLALILVALAGASATLWQAAEARAQARAAMAASDRAMVVSEFLISLFEASDPDLYGNRPPDARTLLDAGLNRMRSEFRDQPETRLDLMLVLAQIYGKLGENELAESLIDDSAALEHGSRLQQARAWMIQSIVNFDRGEAESAVIAAGAGLDLLDADAPLALQLGLGLTEARALNRAGRRHQAVAAARRQLELLEASALDEPNLRLAILAELIGFLTMANRATEALVYAEEANRMIAAGVGIPTTILTALTNHSHALSDLGRLSESTAQQRQALAVVENAYPRGHRLHAGMAGSLGARLQLLGQMTEAEHYFKQALASFSELYDQPNLHSASVHNNYGLFLLLMERPVDALSHLEIATGVAIDAFGRDDPRTLSAKLNLGYCYSLLDDPRAESLIRQVVSGRRTMGGETGGDVAVAIGVLSDHFRRTGQAEMARAYSEQAMNMIADLPDAPLHVAIGPSLHHARNLAALGEHQSAQAVFEATWEVLTTVGPDTGHMSNRFVEAYSEWLAAHDPERGRDVIETWLATEQAQGSQQTPPVQRLQHRLLELQ